MAISVAAARDRWMRVFMGVSLATPRHDASFQIDM
jgi:hypothetical protein